MELTRKGWDRRAHSKGAIFFFFFRSIYSIRMGLRLQGGLFLQVAMASYFPLSTVGPWLSLPDGLMMRERFMYGSFQT